MVSLGNLNLKLNLDVDADSLRFFRAQKITRSAAFWNNNRRCLASDHALTAPSRNPIPENHEHFGCRNSRPAQKNFSHESQLSFSLLIPFVCHLSFPV